SPHGHPSPRPTRLGRVGREWTSNSPAVHNWITALQGILARRSANAKNASEPRIRTRQICSSAFGPYFNPASTATPPSATPINTPASPPAPRRGSTLTVVTPGLARREPGQWPVGKQHWADEVLARHGAPGARIARMNAVVAEEEVVARTNARPRSIFSAAECRVDVRLCQSVAVDEDVAAAFRDQLSRT